MQRRSEVVTTSCPRTDLGRVEFARHEVQQQEHREAQGREKQRRHQSALLPLPSLERFVQDRAAVARRHTHQHVQQQHRHRKTAAVGRVDKPI